MFFVWFSFFRLHDFILTISLWCTLFPQPPTFSIDANYVDVLFVVSWVNAYQSFDIIHNLYHFIANDFGNLVRPRKQMVWNLWLFRKTDFRTAKNCHYIVKRLQWNGFCIVCARHFHRISTIRIIRSIISAFIQNSWRVCRYLSYTNSWDQRIDVEPYACKEANKWLDDCYAMVSICWFCFCAMLWYY